MPADAGFAGNLGVVAIGRNEGPRLRACLESLRPFGLPVVYVDSGSTDGSLSTAADFAAAEDGSVSVWSLDPARPFTASRARREGFEQLLAANPALRYVFFVDGDCEVDPGWPAAAVAALDADDEIAAVAGRRREKSLEASWYNRLCDIEWDTPIGPCAAIGGDGVYRVAAYRQAGGFDPTVPAGEEPELCRRISSNGWRLQRIDAEMSRHDAAMTHFGQWAQRQVRTGYGGADVERRFRLGLFDRLIRGSLLWSVAVPIASLVSMGIAYTLGGPVLATAVCMAVAALFLLQVLRIAMTGRGLRLGWTASFGFGVFTMLAKPLIALGAFRSWVGWLFGRRAQIIEYKGAASAAGE